MHLKKLYIFALIFSLGFSAVRASSPQAYIHTDRYCYASGDIAFIKAYLPAYLNCNCKQTLFIDILSPKGSFLYGELLKMDNGLAQGYLPVHDSLQTGYYTIRAYTDESKNTSRKIIAQKNIYVANRFAGNEKVYENAEIPVVNKTNSGNNQTGKCSIKLNKASYTSREQTSFTLLNSSDQELYASITVKPSYKLESELSTKNYPINQLKELPSTNSGNTTSATDPGIVISGIVSEQSTGKVLENTVVFLSFQDSLIRLRYDITDADGNFCFYLNGYHGQQTAYLNAFRYPEMSQLTNVTFEMNSNFLDEKGENLTGKVIGFKPASDTMTVLKSIVKKAYQQASSNNIDIPLRDTLPLESIFLTGKISQTVFPGDFIRLKDFEDIAREILPLVRYRETKEGYKLSLIDSKSEIVRENPVVFIDGVPTTDYELFASLSTDKIERIDIKSQPRAFGDVLFENGMLFIQTKKNNFWSLNTQTYNPEIVLQCHQLPLEIIFPDYSEKNLAENPDFRHILYWNPSVTLTPDESWQGSFYTSDEKGEFVVILEGISKTGEPVYQQKIITVQ